VESAFAFASAHAAGNTALHGFLAYADNLGINAFAVQRLCNFAQGCKRVAILSWASVDE
jgi:hypothetical protein